jgi:hypothetical protein
LSEKENNLEKEKTGFSKINEKNEINQSDEVKGKKSGQLKLAGKGLNDNKLKKQRKLKDKYECNISNLF